MAAAEEGALQPQLLRSPHSGPVRAPEAARVPEALVARGALAGAKVIVHDYAGHPFQVELSRELARRGYAVVHAYFADDCGPKGDLVRRPGDPQGLRFEGLRIGRYAKGNLVRRRFGDLAYGRALAALVRSEGADLVLSGNTPTEAQHSLVAACRDSGAACIPWIQDFYSLAVTRLLGQRLGSAGRLIGSYYQRLERRQLARADAVVIITDQFRELAERWCGDPAKVFTIENWGHLGISPLPKENAWSVRHGLAQGFNFLYSGTLGLKHDPVLLVELARRMSGRARLVVAAQGLGIERLQQLRDEHGLDNLVLLPLQPFSDLPSVLACADVAVAVIEPEAGAFSVPSKVQSYLCARRPVLLSAPRDNLAAQVLERERAGLVTAPGNTAAFLVAAERLLADAALRDAMAARGRTYAEAAYDIASVADRFESVFRHARSRNGLRARGRATHPPTEKQKGLEPWQAKRERRWCAVPEDSSAATWCAASSVKASGSAASTSSSPPSRPPRPTTSPSATCATSSCAGR